MRHWLTLVPFLYTAQTRLTSGRDYLYLMASQWGLGLVVLYFLSNQDPLVVLLNYLIGYIAFISLYEVGYLTNDVWDAKRGGDGRARFDGDATILFIVLFVAIRIAT